MPRRVTGEDMPEDEVGFRFLADNSTDVICRAGTDMVLHYVSPSCFHVLGWKPEEMLGKRPDAFFLHEDAAVFAASFSPGFDESPVTVRMRTKDGTLAWVEIRRRMVCDATPGAPRETLLVLHDITERKRLEERLSMLEATDARTGLATARAFDEVLDREWSRSLREGSHISLLLLDFHDFKRFHDSREHVEGDRCLARAAAAVIGVLRTSDFSAQYGAEAIAIILPSTGARGAAQVAAKVRWAIEPLGSLHREKMEDQGWVMVSIGIATVLARPGGMLRMPELLRIAADNALRRAISQDQGGKRLAPSSKAS